MACLEPDIAITTILSMVSSRLFVRDDLQHSRSSSQLLSHTQTSCFESLYAYLDRSSIFATLVVYLHDDLSKDEPCVTM